MFERGEPAPGTLLDGKYVVEAVLGRGGMGTVVRAKHTILRHDVAIKVPAPDVRADSDTSQRLLREARAAASLKSEHVCRVLDVGLVDAVPYIVMELLDGMDLAGILRRKPMLTPACSTAIFVDVCDAIAEAHGAGIVHRDIKPQNVFIAHRPGKRPLVKVVDFGISKVTSPDHLGEAVNLTTTSALLGTPSFVAPEQISSSRDVDGRADIWAIGVCLYRATTGALPFEGWSVMDLAVRIMSQDVLPPSSADPDFPPALERVILRCLEKERERRYPDIQSLLDDLRAAVARDGTEFDELVAAMALPDPRPPKSASNAKLRTESGLDRPRTNADDGGATAPSGAIGVALQATLTAAPTPGEIPAAAAVGPLSSTGLAEAPPHPSVPLFLPVPTPASFRVPAPTSAPTTGRVTRLLVVAFAGLFAVTATVAIVLVLRGRRASAVSTRPTDAPSAAGAGGPPSSATSIVDPATAVATAPVSATTAATTVTATTTATAAAPKKPPHPPGRPPPKPSSPNTMPTIR